MLMQYRNYFTPELKQIKITDYMHTNISIATTCSPPPEHGQYKNGILDGSSYSVETTTMHILYRQDHIYQSHAICYLIT